MTNFKILIIDDDPTTCTLLQTTLELEGYQTAAVYSIENDNIVALLNHHQPDLLFLDFYLSARETLQFMTSIRDSVAWQRLPVLMTSAIDHSADCLAAGATGFMLKPFNWDELIDNIHKILASEKV
jgi:CheY-like chemotaxis protein